MTAYLTTIVVHSMCVKVSPFITVCISTEIPLLLVFFVLVFLSGTAAYVHVYVREAYTFGIFVTLEFFQVTLTPR